MDLQSNEKEVTPTGSMITCISLLFFYYIVRFIFCDRYSVKKHSGGMVTGLSGILLTVILFQQITTNNAATKQHCRGDMQGFETAKYTFVPLIVFGGTIYILLNVYPSWKSPFSNTIGYLVASMFGLRSTFNSMLKTSSNDGTDTINKIYKDPSMLINELQPDSPTVNRTDSDFDTELKRLAKANIFKEGWEKNAKKLYNLVVIKDMVASIVWYSLTFALIIATSFNGIMNINCIRSEKTMATGKQIGDYSAKLAKEAKNKVKENFLGGKASSSLSGSASIF